MTGARLLPVGTVYDPFVNRGLDALIYACYQDARFLLVSTPSGLTLAPEGGQHQSINTPLIGMAADRLASFEPAYVDELAILLRHAFVHMQAAGWLGGVAAAVDAAVAAAGPGDRSGRGDCGGALGGAAGGGRADRDRLSGAGGARGRGGVRRTGDGGPGRRAAGDHQPGPAARGMDDGDARAARRASAGRGRTSRTCWHRWRRARRW